MPFLVFLIALGGLSIWMSNKDFLIWKGDEPEIAPWRKEKLEKELKELNEAEQYALVVSVSGVFPCYSCVDRNEIFLNTGEVWKYGVTRKGQAGRYKSGLPFLGLSYSVQFEGNLQACFKEEKLKIYQYPLLKENLKRNKPLIRPPGNKRDD